MFTQELKCLDIYADKDKSAAVKGFSFLSYSAAGSIAVPTLSPFNLLPVDGQHGSFWPLPLGLMDLSEIKLIHS